MVVVDHPAVTWSHAALAALLSHGAVVVVCGADHLPAGLLLPLPEHTEVVTRIHDQIDAKQPVKKRLWKQLVVAKIKAQAANLNNQSPAYKKLINLAKEVRSGDPSNIEAQAAKVYWGNWLGTTDGNDAKRFRRSREGSSPNNLLNYGYAIMRAAITRALVGTGLLPALGLHHSNRSNAFCLADDLIEPFRPLVDRRARDLFTKGMSELSQTTKAGLLQLLAEPVYLNDEKGPLMVSVQKMVSSLVKCYEGSSRTLDIPIMPNQRSEAG